MENNFDNVMSKKTNEELINIVTIDINKYQKAAIESAKKEIEIRDIDPHNYIEIVEKITVKNHKIDELHNNTVSSGTRFVNYIIDSIVITFIIVIIVFSSLFILRTNFQSAYFLVLLMLFLSNLFYYAFMEFKYQKTVSKFITKTKVVNSNGEKPNLNDIIIRTLCRLIPFDRISFLFTKNGFHDKLSNTKVIND
jgi:uncharacterized RDD family membrane protein YckC